MLLFLGSEGFFCYFVTSIAAHFGPVVVCVCVFVMTHALKYHGVQNVTFANKLGYTVLPNPHVPAIKHSQDAGTFAGRILGPREVLLVRLQLCNTLTSSCVVSQVSCKFACILGICKEWASMFGSVAAKLGKASSP